MSQPLPPATSGSATPRRDLTTWYVAAAVFWFEVVGLLAVAALIVVAPLTCFGDPDPSAPPPCAEGIPILNEGIPIQGFVALVVIGLVLGGIWVATRGQPRARGIAFGAIGVVVLVPIVVVGVLVDLVGAVVLYLWFGIPATLFLGAAYNLLAHPRPATRD